MESREEDSSSQTGSQLVATQDSGSAYVFRRDYDVAWLQAKVRHELLLPWLQVRGSREVFCLDCSWLGAGLLSL